MFSALKTWLVSATAFTILQAGTPPISPEAYIWEKADRLTAMALLAVAVWFLSRESAARQAKIEALQNEIKSQYDERIKQLLDRIDDLEKLIRK